MNWTQLLTPERLSGRPDDPGAPRTPFQRDFDRVLYSSAFRRLGDKTQVFPVPLNDHIHSRLTHSLEVATIGRSLGTLVAQRLEATGDLALGFDARDVGDCVAAACLAHDLGNPPFGHVGEDAIQEFFRKRESSAWLCGLAPGERDDLLRFEGNAQSFRIVTRVARPNAFGLDLTSATLGALVKYPCPSPARRKGAAKGRAKHGLNQAEQDTFARVAEITGLPPRSDGGVTYWERHPLALLTEAADDVAYRIIDLEDGLRLGHVDGATFVALLEPLVRGERGCPDDLARPRGREATFDLAHTLRGLALGRLIVEVADVFVAHRDAILDGRFHDALLDGVPSAAAVERITQVDLERCYRARDVLKMELSGAVAIEGVLDALTDAVVAPGSLRAQHLRGLLPDVMRDGPDVYPRLLRVTDHVSGMTDSYLLRLYRELSGIRLPGGRD